MGNCECGRLKGNPCGTLRLNTINVTMPSATRARGHKGGWKPLDPNAPWAQMAKTMYQDKSMQVRDICQTLRISRSTLYRWMASQQQQAATPIQA